MSADFSRSTKAQLLQMCDARNITCRKTWTKPRIIQALTPDDPQGHNISRSTKAQLLQMCDARNITCRKTWTKPRIIQALADSEPSQPQPRPNIIRPEPEEEKEEDTPRRSEPEEEKEEDTPRRSEPEEEKEEDTPRRSEPEGEKSCDLAEIARMLYIDNSGSDTELCDRIKDHVRHMRSTSYLPPRGIGPGTGAGAVFPRSPELMIDEGIADVDSDGEEVQIDEIEEDAADGDILEFEDRQDIVSLLENIETADAETVSNVQTAILKCMGLISD